MMWLADCSFAPHSQVGVNAISFVRCCTKKTEKPALSLLSLNQAGLGSVIPGG